MDGLVGVVLKRRVAHAGDEFGLVNHRTIQLVGRAGVERAAGQGRVGDTVDEPLRSHVEFVGETQAGMTYLAATRIGNGRPPAAPVPVVLPGLMVMKRWSGYWRARYAIHRAPMYLACPKATLKSGLWLAQ